MIEIFVSDKENTAQRYPGIAGGFRRSVMQTRSSSANQLNEIMLKFKSLELVLLLPERCRGLLEVNGLRRIPLLVRQQNYSVQTIQSGRKVL